MTLGTASLFFYYYYFLIIPQYVLAIKLLMLFLSLSHIHVYIPIFYFDQNLCSRLVLSLNEGGFFAAFLFFFFCFHKHCFHLTGDFQCKHFFIKPISDYG